MARLLWLTALALCVVVAAETSGEGADAATALRGAEKPLPAKAPEAFDGAGDEDEVAIPADEFADALENLEEGESLVDCHGHLVCHDGWYWVGGVKKCRGAVYCSSYAVVLGTGGAEAAQEAGGEAAVAPAQHSNVAPEDLQAVASMEAEAQGLEDTDAAEDTGIKQYEESLIVCRGVQVCRSWGWVGGRRVCRGGFYCRPF
mmetsp:Transcript_19084/g.54781  ORF Transcript_19084/g.54781 Transcript_19084/m.54781 type:complete len:202 (-) Transcript_19084:82-687(-)